MKIIFIASLILLPSAYLLLAPIVATPLYNKLLFYPDYPVRYDESTYQLNELSGYKKEDVQITTADQKKLHGWFFNNPHSRNVALVSHGNASNISNRTGLAETLLQLGFSVLLYDYEGYGLSEGEPSIPNICSDGLAAFDYLCAAKHYAPKDILLYGESLGCAVSCNVSRERDCGAIILQSGFSSLRSISTQKFPPLVIYPELLYPTPTLDNLAILKQKWVPVLFIHGVQDPIIPASHSQLLFDSVPQPKQIALLPNSEHSVSDEDYNLFAKSLETFVSKKFETSVSAMIKAEPTHDSVRD